MRRVLVILSFACASAFAQSNLTFEVASVKPSGPRSVRNSDGGPGTHDPERFTFTRAVLRDLLYRAYGVHHYREQISGPGWIDSETYDVTVKVPAGTTKEQFRTMMRNLLAERFNLKVHHDTRILPVYELLIAKNGPKLKNSVPGADAHDIPPAQPQIGVEDQNGFPQLPRGRPTWSMMNRAGRSRLAARQQPVSVLTQILDTPLERPIIDKTGLTGVYDFTLEFDPRPSAEATPLDGKDAPAPDIFVAIQQQLGLKLLDAKASFDIVVVDSADKLPTENE